MEVARKRKPADIRQQNQFAPLQEEELTEAVEAVPTVDASHGTRVRPATPKWLATSSRVAPRLKRTIIGKIGHSCEGQWCEDKSRPFTSSNDPGSEADYVCCGVRVAVAAPADEPMPCETQAKPIRREGPKSRSSTSLATFIEKRAQHLRPLSQNDEWETIEAILDSGASVIVIPPHVGRGYEIQPGEASKAGVRYKVANVEEIPNLGEKNLLVMTEEGTWRGLKAQVAEVSKALQSVRGLVKAGHLVVVGDGEDGCQHYVLNKTTGEINSVADDGINYLMRLHVVPQAVSPFGGPVAAR